MKNTPEFASYHAYKQEAASKSQSRSPLLWWYRLSAPDEASEISQNALLPRARLASIILLIAFIGEIAFIPAALTSVNLHVLPPLIVVFVVTCIAVPLNKRGKVTAVGVLTVIVLDAALIASLLSYTHFTLVQNALPIYDLFVLSDIVAISLLPPSSILYVSSFHSAFMLLDIVLQPHSPDLQVLVNQTHYTFMVRPLLIQLAVALLTYLWVRNTMKALERANKAEVIAKLEHTIAMQKQELDEGVQQILNTLVLAANGELGARAPLIQQHALWQVGVGLNTLLARLQRANQNERELQQIKMELKQLIYSVQEAKALQAPLRLTWGSTDVEALGSELRGCSLFQPPRRW